MDQLLPKDPHRRLRVQYADFLSIVLLSLIFFLQVNLFTPVTRCERHDPDMGLDPGFWMFGQKVIPL